MSHDSNYHAEQDALKVLYLGTILAVFIFGLLYFVVAGTMRLIAAFYVGIENKLAKRR